MADTPKDASDILRNVKAFLDSYPYNTASRATQRIVQIAVSSGWKVGLFGGLPRDAALRGEQASPRDLDIVLSGATLSEIQDAYRPYLVRKNKYDGIILNVEGIEADVWPLEETWGIRQLKIQNPSFASLLDTTFFNLEAIVVEIEKGGRTLHEGGFLQAIKDQELEINYSDNPYPLLCLTRAIVLAKRFGLQFGPNLLTYLKSTAQSYSVSQVLHLQSSHYRTEALSREEILAILPDLDPDNTRR